MQYFYIRAIVKLNNITPEEKSKDRLKNKIKARYNDMT